MKVLGLILQAITRNRKRQYTIPRWVRRVRTHCMLIILPDGAKLSWLLQLALRFFSPKNRDILGDAAEPTLCMSESDA